jgi:hypothetical protein
MSLLNPSRYSFKYLQDNGVPRTLVYTGSSKIAASSSMGRTQKKLNTYLDIYQTENVVFASIQVTAYNTIMVGYSIESENIQAKLLLEQLCRRINLMSALLEATKNALIFGDAYLEKRRQKDGTVAHLFPVDPQTMIIDIDNYGRVVSYHQEINGQKGPILKPSDILHFRFFEIPSSPYGLSLIEPNLKVIERKRVADESISNALIRHGTGKLLVKVGTEADGQIPPPETMDDIRDSLEDLNESNEIIVPWMIDVSTIDEKGIQGVDEYYSYFLSQLVTGLMCPEEALGLGKGTTEATAKTKAVLWERMLKAYQYSISQVLERELFNEYLLSKGFIDQATQEPVYSSIIFDSVTEEDEAMRAKWLGNLIGAFKGGKLPLTLNEVRKLLKLAPRKDMEDVVDLTPQGAVAKPTEAPAPNGTPPQQNVTPQQVPQGEENNNGVVRTEPQNP